MGSAAHLTTDFGGHSGGVTPFPIPNTEVKPSSADGTWDECPWESRTPPDFFRKGRRLRLPFSYFSVRVSGVSSPRLRVPLGIPPHNVRCVSCQQIGLQSLDPPRLGPVPLGPVPLALARLGHLVGARRTLDLSLLLQSAGNAPHAENQARILRFPSQKSGSMTVRCIPVVHLVPRSSASQTARVAGEAVRQQQLPCMHRSS